jgi:DNA-binding transcriptional MerR regulator
MIRIGDFSKLSRVSVKTLRFYDEVELLKPVEVDRFTGYRYYESGQLARLNRILALKDLGFSLDEICKLLDSDLPVEQLRGMLKLREAESRQRVQEEAERLKRIEARLRQIEQEDSMCKYDVVIKKVEPFKVASLRGVVPTPPEQGSLWRDLEGYLAMQHVRPSGACLSLYHDEEYKEQDWDIEVCEPLAEDIPASKRVEVKVLPVVETMACTIHHGSLVSISEAYDAIMRWVDENGYRIIGPVREVYLKEARNVGQTDPETGTAVNVSQTDPETVTEIQIPVEKA